MTPEESAKELIKIDFPIEDYEELQARRSERLNYWKLQNIPVLIEREEELFEYGEKVLTLLRKEYSK